MSEEQSPQGDVERLLAESDWLKRLALGLVRDPQAAEDLVQETWVVALRRAPRSGTGELRAWLAVVLRNFSLRERRNASLRAQHEALGARREDSVPAAQTIAARVELQRELADAMLALEDPFRDALVLRYFDGLSAIEVARRLGITHDNARQRISRGLAKLRARMDREHGSRGAWLALVRPLVTESAAAPLALPASLGGLAMGTGLKLAAVAALAILALSAWNWRSERASSIEAAGAVAPLPVLHAPALHDRVAAQIGEAPGSRTPVEAESAGAPPAMDPTGADSAITGEVRDARGSSVAAASVAAVVFGDQGFNLLDNARRSERRELDLARSDEDGRFRLEIGRSANVQLEVDAGERGACVLGERQAGENVIAIVLPSGTIRGRIARGKDAEPAVGAHVRAVLALPDRGEEDRPRIRLGRDAAPSAP